LKKNHGQNMSLIEERLKELGLSLSTAKPPVGNYLGSKSVGELLFAAARVGDLTGEVGTEVSEEQAYGAARHTVLTILAIIKQDIKDLDMLAGVVKVTGFIRSSSTFTRQPKVVDGASDLLIEIFGEAGRHARTATGVAQLPFGASVQLEIIFQLKQNHSPAARRSPN
jgi:enamine deaminase RidA (YjgF/YER057c/UK114 family)